MMDFENIEKVKISKGLDFILLPRPTVLVTCLDDNGNPNIITVAWISPVSHEPLVVAIAISPKRYSHDLIDRRREFVVNLPSIHMAEYSNWCGRKSGRKYDKFTESSWTPEPGKTISTPHIAQCYAFLECKVIQQVITGDHTTFFGEAVDAYVAKDTVHKVRQGGPPAYYFDPKKIKTLLHLGGDMYVTNEEKYVEFEVSGVIDV
jgi:flavin reductase (DIM6/NTAB) family NADH-FMN oxidoreductase RutF